MELMPHATEGNADVISMLPSVYGSEGDNRQQVLNYEIKQLQGQPLNEVNLTERIDFYQKANKVIGYNLAFEL
jgi:hypothetical protein